MVVCPNVCIFAVSYIHHLNMKEIDYKDMKFNPFNLIGGEWMLVTASDELSRNTMYLK